MRKQITILFIGFLFTVLACGGGPPLKPTPPHLLTGTDQIKKGTALYQKGCFKRAVEHFFRAHELYAASDQLDGVAMSFNNLGTAYRATGDFESAIAFFDKAHEIYKDLGDRAGIRQSLANKSAVLMETGRLEQAEAVINEASGISPGESGKPFAPLMSDRGILLTRKKDYAGAEKILKEALAAADPENVSETATVHYALGHLMFEMKRQKEAVSFFQAALAADRSAGYYKGMADDLSGMGRSYLELGNREAAVKSWERSIKIYALIKLPEEVKKTMADIKTAARGTGIDIRVTELFVNRWLEGKAYEKPCED
jgi:tetratricopeptide (TPR) repeat protein